MLSTFPFLFTYQQLAPFLLRVILGLTLGHFAYRKIMEKGQSSGSNSKLYGWVEAVTAVLLVIGLWTQIAALINAVILIIKIGFKFHEKKLLTDGVNYYILLLTIAISVMLTGAGAFAFDLAI